MEKLQPKTGIKKRNFKNPGPGSHRQFGINNKGFYIILVAKTPSASTFWLLRHKEALWLCFSTFFCKQGWKWRTPSERFKGKGVYNL